MSKLEDFVRKNRPEFDTFEPPDDLWQDISQELGPEKSNVRPLWFRTPVMRYAAAVLIVLSAGVGLYQLGRYSANSDRLAEAGKNTVNLAQINPELAQAEVYYTSLINQEKAMLNPAEVERLGLKDDFSQDLSVLDSTYQVLKKQLVTEPNKEPIVAAMIRNLQLRVEILREQIETLQRVGRYSRQQTQI